MVAELLFCDGDLDVALAEQRHKLQAEIAAVPEDHVLHADEAAWVEALVGRWRVEAPEIHSDQMWLEPPREIQVDVSRDWGRAISDPSRPYMYPGYRIVVHIPFSGDAGIFNLRASQFTLNPPHAEVGQGEVRDVVEYPHDAPIDIRARADGLVEALQRHLACAHDDVERFNGVLADDARIGIAARRERLRANYDRLAATGLPIGGHATDGPKTYIVDAIVRRPAPVLHTTADDVPMALEPVLADGVFEHILGVIRSAGRDMERSPNTYAGMGEEDRRQTILLALNTHYRGQTMAEAFNVSGKTDLLIRHEGQNLFIGECKFWSGSKAFLETVDQLFRYRAWRDTKLAIIVFVKEKGLTTIVERARDALSSHHTFVGWKAAGTDTELRCAVSWSGDDRRHADLAVFLIHTPE
jgi:hypothetical protein